MVEHAGLELLRELGAPPWLVRHHELVLEAATRLCDLVAARFELRFDRAQVLMGAAIHDAGKLVHPEEMSAPGHHHEHAGERLLLARGVDPRIARCCVTHAAWDADGIALEDLLVALADTLWKGKRDAALERVVLAALARASEREAWDVFDALDTICDDIAADGRARLARSRV